MKTTTKFASTLLASAIALAACTAFAASTAIPKAEYKQSYTMLKADRDASLAKCDPLSGSAKSMCKAEAKGAFTIASAELDTKYKPGSKTTKKLRDAKASVAYDITKMKCDELTGNTKDVCMKDAKAAMVTAKADAKVAKITTDAKSDQSTKVADARKDASKEKMEADFKAAKERCDTFSGDTKTRCVDEIKAKFGKV